MVQAKLVWELMGLLLIVLMAGGVVGSGLSWLYAVYPNKHQLLWMGNSSAWGIWYFVVTVHVYDRQVLLQWLETRYGSLSQYKKRICAASLAVGALFSGVPAARYYMHHYDQFSACGAILLSAGIGAAIVAALDRIGDLLLATASVYADAARCWYTGVQKRAATK